MPDRHEIDERRRYPRFRAAWPVEISVERATIVGETVDVSEYGLFIATAPTTALKVGQSCRVEILVGLANPFSVIADVRHVSDRGAGVETRQPLPVGLSERVREAL
jgi:hypothetical protein